MRIDLLHALHSINTPASFACFGALKRTPPASLFVEGVGDIEMPLSESQARQMIAAARQAPYGKGSETLVDTSVRNTWELDASQFTFKNPSWPGYIQKISAAVGQDLGINTTIKAEVYKMLLYEKGAMFKSHTHTEKIPGMFGSLVICFPSAHQGGEVLLKHNGQQKLFKSSEYTQSFASWYSDVHHEVLPVTSGYRWVVTYNLAIDPQEARPSTALLTPETRVLREVMSRWLSKDARSRENEFLYHRLDHDYTEANISLNALKSQDLARVQVLKALSNEFPVDIFLGLLEKGESGPCERHFEWGSYRGRSRYDRYDEDDEDDEDEGVFHPLEEAPEVYFTELVKLCKQAWVYPPPRSNFKYDPGPSIDGESMRDILKIALRRGDHALFEMVAVHHEGHLPLDFFTWLRESRGTSNGLIQDPPVAVWKGLTAAMLSYPHLSDQYWAIVNLLPITGISTLDAAKTPDSLLVWIRESIRSCVEACTSKTLGQADGLAMVGLARYLKDQVAFLSETALPIVEKKIECSSFVLAFLNELRKQCNNVILPTDRVVPLYRAVANLVYTSMDFATLKSEAGFKLISTKRPRHYNLAPPSRDELRTVVSHQLLADHFSAMIQISTDADDLVQPLTSKIIAAVPRFTPTELNLLWLPFLRSLLSVLGSNRVPFSTPYYQQLFRTVSTTYITKYVGREPSRDTNLARPRVNCDCRDCGPLNTFLVSATENVARFRVGKQRRQHLHQKLDSADIDCTHTTLREGSPQTLVVTKSFKHNAVARKLWTSRRAEASALFTSFPQVRLELLLGQDYSKIVNMEEISVVRRPPVSAAASRLTMNQANASLPPANMKRKLPSDELEIIDLTND
ncbi:hypothetical protein BGZ61DRAFT_495252 [Ilyonectria robusta]|uniref:uncharacterized protein n=1 Tax=Ilyonectria robusta TaxID=1079257 RepID=UPI001E8E5035|nr:uncharacterized protein BGZ61DRAFT_495252 [Ilyonectria robusta]KAH8684945.1 hypothetical protein BGZ61DRAFT_495252 [Ilyonectria robusta]